MGISTHVLDTSLGRPAIGVAVTLSRLAHSDWLTLYITATDTDGRVKSLLPDHPLEPGLYRIHFDTADHFRPHAIQSLYPYIEITFEVRDPDQHYHIPLLITANGYTTYRGT